MRWNDFSRSLVFAAVAAAAYLPFGLALAPLLGSAGALAAYAVAVVPLYLAGLGATRRSGIGAGLLAGAIGAAALLILPAREVILVAVLGLALARSGLLYRARFARSLLLEAVLLVAGLALARHWLAAPLLNGSLAVWGFFLVQSLFFLVGGVQPREDRTEFTDPFEAARAQALAILDDGPTG